MDNNFELAKKGICESLETLGELTDEDTLATAWNWVLIAREAKTIMYFAEQQARAQYEAVFGKAAGNGN